MSEFLTPEHTLYFQKALNPSSVLPYSLVAVDYKGSLVPLRSSLANTVAQDVILPSLFPTFHSSKSIRSEVRVGNSRFDFVIDRPSETPLAIEVKSCSLVEEGVALFPDAPSSRALKHLRELEKLQTLGWGAMILLVISHGSPRVFRPLVHADPELALALARTTVEVRAVSIHWSRRGRAEIDNLQVPLDLGFGGLALEQTCTVFVRHQEPGTNSWWIGYGGVEGDFRKWSRSLGTGAGIRQVFGQELSSVQEEFESVASRAGWERGKSPPRGHEKYRRGGKELYWWRVGDFPPEYYRPYLDLVFRCIVRRL